MEPTVSVQELLGHVNQSVTGLVSLSRLEALRLLGEVDRASKLRAAEKSCLYADCAALIEDFGSRYYQNEPALVHWPTRLLSEVLEVLSGGGVDLRRLNKDVDEIRYQLSNSFRRFRTRVDGTLMAAAVKQPYLQVEALLLTSAKGDSRVDILEDGLSHPDRPHKVLTGPVRVNTDPIFEPSYSMMDQKVPFFGTTLTQTVPYLWTTCVGETMAAELCALSATEYDGLPLAFYRDMAKQGWDEMRHAVCYLDAALTLLPDLERELEAGDPLLASLKSFHSKGHGLPIPRELNLYETVQNASLAERLILFQIQTEAPGASRKRRNQNSPLCQRYPELAAALEYDRRDEVVHARIGRRWLAYLFPDPAERQRAIEAAGLLRSVLLLTSFVHHEGGGLEQLMDHYIESTPS